MPPGRGSVSFSWLHLTDLHQGQREQQHLLPRVQTLLYDDLGKLHDKTGPWDLVLFTGDLTQRGSKAEFAALNKSLLHLWAFLESLGSQPKFLAVPGNHDLVRPPKDDPRLAEVARWPELAEQFWTDASSAPRALVGEAFANYTSWWNDHPFQRAANYRTGLIPGDFAVVLEKRGFRLGVMGLNSAFLQLGDDDFEGKLDLGLAQFHSEATEGNGSLWAGGCHAALLLTHHPLSWLHEGARDTFATEIASSFVAHLHGHMHDAELTGHRSLGTASGYRRVQGRSLFGLEHWGTKQSRSHGYSIGRLSTQRDQSLLLEVWPRLLVDQRMVADPYGGVLDPAKGSVSEKLPLRVPFTFALPRTERGASAHAPDAPFDRSWYVRRNGRDDTALGYLDVHGKPAVLLGPKHIGKTWVCRYLCETLRNRTSNPVRVAEVDVGGLAARTGAATTDAFLLEFCVKIGAAVQLSRTEVVERWDRVEGAPAERATGLFRDVLVAAAPRCVIVAIDRLEAIPEAVRLDLFSLLRAWCDQSTEAPWDRMRLLLVIPRIPDLGAEQSPFTITRSIAIEAFSPEETEAMISYYALPASGKVITATHRKLAGHPRWVRTAAFLAKTHDRGLADTVGELVTKIADEYRQRLRGKRKWREALVKIDKGDSDRVATEILDELYEEGLIVRKAQASSDYELRMREPLTQALRP